jgi:3-hydroxyisobutyrate dehydrogenase-like beta-hydroxyacid dehydrogenase
MERIGFIGLGIMGKPMAANLVAAGYPLTVCDFNASSSPWAPRRPAARATSRPRPTW